MTWQLIPAPAGLVIRRVPKDRDGNARPEEATTGLVVALALHETDTGFCELFACEADDFQPYDLDRATERALVMTAAAAEEMGG